MALGILSFALLAIIGLLNVGLGAGRSAQVDTIQSTVARSILASVRTNTPGSFSGTTTWYTFDGVETNESGAFLRCQVSTNAPPPSIPAANMVSLVLNFQYPVSAPVSNRTQKSLHASFVRQP